MSNNSKTKFILGFNWKMNPDNLDTAFKLKKIYDKVLFEHPKYETYLFLPSIFLSDLADFGFNYGIQDVSEFENGAYSGQLSAKMAIDFDCQSCLVGRSETRKYFGYSLQTLQNKLDVAIKNNLKTVYCTGYSKSSQTVYNQSELQTEIKDILSFLLAKHSKSIIQDYLIIAYEPIWAIGSGQTADYFFINQATSDIRQILLAYDLAEIPVLYGGSVNSKNFANLKQQTTTNGFLIGGASLIPEEIENIAKI